MTEKKKSLNNHHPFCEHKYLTGTGSWNCRCDYLNEYDEWVKIKESEMLDDRKE